MIESLDELEKNEIKKILDEANVSTCYAGYEYIVTAVPIIIDDIYTNFKFNMKEIYMLTAEKHKTTSAKVAYAIRNVCDNTCIAKKLGKSKVSNKKLLYIIAVLIMKKLNID